MISLSSTAGVQANGRLPSYSASKAAANALSQALARNKPDYKFFSICPGPTNTPMRERTSHDAATKQSPMVVAGVVDELIADSTTYTSGDIIVVKDGVATIEARI